MSGEEGAGTVLGVAVAGALVGAFVLVAPLAVLLGAAHQASAAADAAALGAGDTALGLVAGVPCDAATRIALADGGRLATCRQHGDLVRVRVVVDALGLPVGADAVAGPRSDAGFEAG